MLDRPLRARRRARRRGARAARVATRRPLRSVVPAVVRRRADARAAAGDAAPGRRSDRARGAWLVRGVTTSAWVALTTAPITAYHFHQVAAGGVVGNLVLTPVVELVALPLGLAGLVVGEVVAPVGDALDRLASAIVGVVDDRSRACSRASRRSARSRSRSASTMAVLVALGVARDAPGARYAGAGSRGSRCALVWALARDRRRRRRAARDVPRRRPGRRRARRAARRRDLARRRRRQRPSARDLTGRDRPGPRDRRVARRVRATRGSISRSSRTRTPITTSASRARVDDADRRAVDRDGDSGEPARGRGRPTARRDCRASRRSPAALAARGTRIDHPPLGIARSEAGVELMRVGAALRAVTGARDRGDRSGAHRQRQLARRRARLSRPHASCSPATSRPRARTRSSRAGLGARRRRQGRRTTAARPRRPRRSSRATHPALAVISCGAGQPRSASRRRPSSRAGRRPAPRSRAPTPTARSP